MSAARFNPLPLLRGHWKGLADARTDRTASDKFAKGALLLTLPLAVVALLFGWSVKAPQPLLAGVALLAGALLGSFGQITTIRLKLTDRRGEKDPATATDRDALDEGVSHILTAALLAAVDAFLLVIGTNVSADAGVHGVWAAAIIGVSAYLFLTFLMVIPRLYAAYVYINDVSPRVNGFRRDRRGR